MGQQVKPEPGKQFQHYRGRTWTVLDVTHYEFPAGEPVVIASCAANQSKAWPLSQFTGTVRVPSGKNVPPTKEIPRFTETV